MRRLDKMMADAKLAPAQQRKLRAVANGQRPELQRRAVPPKSSGQWEDRYRGIALNPRIVRPGIKSRAEIAYATQGYAREQYAGAPQDGRPDRAAQKAMMQDAYIKAQEGPAPVASVVGTTAAVARPGGGGGGASEEADLHRQITEEIRERQEFLAQMTALGRGAEHETAIRAQIGDRMRDLRRLEQMMREGAS